MLNPRPTDQDLGSGATVDRLVGDALAGTAARRELTLLVADFDKHIEGLAGRAMPLEAQPQVDPVPPIFAEFVAFYREGRQAVLLAPAAAWIAHLAVDGAAMGGGHPLIHLLHTFRPDVPAQPLAEALVLAANHPMRDADDYDGVAAVLDAWREQRGLPAP